jgi:hypothetical protein
MTSDWLTELQHTWPVLSPHTQTEISTSPVQLGSADARVGLDGAGGRHLLVAIADPNDTPASDEVDGSLVVRIRTYTFAGTPRRYVDIVCNRPDLFDLFDEVLSDVADCLETADRPTIAAAEVVERWRALMATRPARMLTLTAQMSLVGELHILMTTAPDQAIDIATWRGPLREPHDIRLPDRALEVKTLGSTSTTIEIHGIQQLDPPGCPLALVLVEVTETDRGRTLPEMVDELLDRATARSDAIRILATAGYSPVDADRYPQTYAVNEVAYVEVAESVPRIVHGSFAAGALPNGVDDVTYRVELEALDPVLIRGESALLAWVEAGG